MNKNRTLFLLLVGALASSAAVADPCESGYTCYAHGNFPQVMLHIDDSLDYTSVTFLDQVSSDKHGNWTILPTWTIPNAGSSSKVGII